LKKGSAVTIVAGEKACILTRIQAIDKTSFISEPGQRYALSDEGTRWVRNWRTPDSKPVRAALSAQALLPTKPKDPLGGSGMASGFLAQVTGNALGTLAAQLLHKRISTSPLEASLRQRLQKHMVKK
jgi:hypothetical protein